MLESIIAILVIALLIIILIAAIIITAYTTAILSKFYSKKEDTLNTKSERIAKERHIEEKRKLVALMELIVITAKKKAMSGEDNEWVMELLERERTLEALKYRLETARINREATNLELETAKARRDIKEAESVNE